MMDGWTDGNDDSSRVMMVVVVDSTLSQSYRSMLSALDTKSKSMHTVRKNRKMER